MKRPLIVAMLLASAVAGGCATAVMGTSHGERTSAQVAADTGTSADVKAKLLAEPSLKTLSISVNTNLGQVTLAGFVNNAAQRELAGRIAGDVKGVKGVRNDLTVK